MTRGIWLAAFAAALAAGPVIAGDDAIPLGRYKPTTGGFSGGVPQSPTLNTTAQTASLPEDTELAHWRGGFYGGYRWGWGGGWGWGNSWAWRGSAWGWNRGWGAPAWGWNGGWGANTWGWNAFARPAWGYGYASFYRPGFAVSYYSAPAFYYPTYYYPTYYGFFPVSGGNAPTVNLNQPREVNPPNPRTDTFQYDGGPSRPIPSPQPVPDRGNPVPPPRIEPATDGTLSIKYTRAATTSTKSAYKYPAYGDK